ncbi:uncharacterized protein LOC121368127 isoform X2 [Gigantopelta aegis]|uniref:uncharacterized protein LOC121368127 isoform X2 n=1 Tax=Gigantopelta aegis TaxID=1735272 RepID=UPI001B88CBAF|nr:uncharacterized protein LOC121368127 isoform X2 [Gigantopelta aegis]
MAASTIRKALRFSWRGKRYSVVSGKQSDYFNTPKPTRSKNPGASSDGESPESDDLQMKTRRGIPRRSDRLTRSVRDAVGTLRQRFRMSTRRRSRLEEGKVLSPRIAKQDSRRVVGKTPPRSCKSDVKIYSPFYIETPKSLVKQRNGTRMGLSVETPTRLKREVEALTANMQALAALTPTTLRERSRRTPATSPLTNGSLRMRTARRRIETTIY